MPVSKEKVKFIAHLYPETVKTVDQMFRQAECRSRSQFIEQAIRYYAGYLTANDDSSYLPNAMLSNMKSIVAESENKISRVIFKVAVELAMVHKAYILIQAEETSARRNTASVRSLTNTTPMIFTSERICPTLTKNVAEWRTCR